MTSGKATQSRLSPRPPISGTIGVMSWRRWCVSRGAVSPDGVGPAGAHTLCATGSQGRATHDAGVTLPLCYAQRSPSTWLHVVIALAELVLGCVVGPGTGGVRHAAQRAMTARVPLAPHVLRYGSAGEGQAGFEPCVAL